MELVTYILLHSPVPTTPGLRDVAQPGPRQSAPQVNLIHRTRVGRVPEALMSSPASSTRGKEENMSILQAGRAESRQASWGLHLKPAALPLSPSNSSQLF